MNFLLNWLRRIFRWSLLIAFSLVGAWIAFENTQPVSLSLLGFSLPEFGLGIYVALILLVGFLLALLALSLTWWPKTLALKKTISDQNKEIQGLKELLISQTAQSPELDSKAPSP